MTDIEFINMINSGRKLEISFKLNDKEKCLEIIKTNLFWDNLDLIIEKLDESLIMTFIKKLSICDNNFLTYDIVKFFKYNFNDAFYIDLFEIIKHSNLDLILLYKYILENNLLNVSSYALFKSMYENNCKELLYNNLDLILKKSYKLIEIKNIVSNDVKFKEKINEFIKNNPDNVIYNLVMSYIGLTKQEIDEEKIFDFVKAIVDEILVSENKKYSDIKYLGEGSSTAVYLIGDKVLKIGSERIPLNIPNNKRFLKPLLRKHINSIKNNEVLFCIEITERVDTNNITEDDVYEIYKEFRDLGYVWADANIRNTGRLLKKNKIYFKEEIKPTKESIHYFGDNEIELDKGELIILDNEFIFEYENFINNLGFENAHKFLKRLENRYQEEKSIKI